MSIPLFLLLSISSFAAGPELYLKSASAPFYPRLALQARVGGTVSLHFMVDERGETSDVEAASGDKLLRDAAIENLQSWKFWPPECACRVRKEAVLVYVLSGDPGSAETPTVTIKWFLKAPVIRVEIEGAPILTQVNP
jgi:TonB family protein